MPVLRTLLALLMALALAACGVDEQAATERSTDPSAEGSVFPVRVEHKYGTTEITTEPKRVVTLGLSDHDAVLALGIKPVGAIDWFKERPYGQWPWTKDLWGDDLPTIVGERDDYKLETILNLKPDVILAQYSGMTKEQYDELSKIAPVVGQPKDYPDYGAPWQDMTRLAGQALGKADEVEQLISDIDDKFAQVREDHPDWQGRTVAVADPYETGEYAVFQANDPKAFFMIEMGFEVPDAINEAAGDNNAAEISSERMDLIDTDLLLFLTLDPGAKQRVEADPLYQGLAASRATNQDKRTLFVPYSEGPMIGAALSFMTVLSIPYALDEFVPQLEQA